jgi:hypothetical protein
MENSLKLKKSGKEEIKMAEIYNVWNVYGVIIATGSFMACQSHICSLLNHGHGEWDDYSVLPVGENYLPWE